MDSCSIINPNSNLSMKNRAMHKSISDSFYLIKLNSHVIICKVNDSNAGLNRFRFSSKEDFSVCLNNFFIRYSKSSKPDIIWEQVTILIEFKDDILICFKLAQERYN